MKTHVMGKIVTNYYKLNEGIKDGKYVERPNIEKVDSEVEWQEICSYEGEAQGVDIIWGGKRIYISETEEVTVIEQRFRADLGDYFQYTDKIIREISKSSHKNLLYPDLQYNLDLLLKDYNKDMIENDDQAKAYCDLHKLNYEETDYDELLKVMGRDDEIKPATVDLTLPSYRIGSFVL